MVETHGDITLGRARRAVELEGLRLVEVGYEPRRVLPPHAHAAANVSLVFAGSFEEHLAAGAVEAGPTSFVLKPSGTVHSNRYGARPSRVFMVEIDAAREAELGLARGGVRWRRGGHAVATLLEVFRAFLSGAPDLERTTLQALEDVGRRLNRDVEAPELGERPARVLRAAEHALSRSAALGSRALAQHVGVHPVYLARLFRAVHGSGIAAYRRRLQVREAARRLAETRASLSDVAAEAGFADQSHLSRSFKAELGVTPGRYGRLVRQAEPEVASVQDGSARSRVV